MSHPEIPIEEIDMLRVEIIRLKMVVLQGEFALLLKSLERKYRVPEDVPYRFSEQHTHLISVESKS